MDKSRDARLTTGIRMVAILLLLPVLAPGWCSCDGSTEQCTCCDTATPPVGRPLCNCADGCSCGQSVPTSQAAARGRIPFRDDPTSGFPATPFARDRVAHSCCVALTDPPIVAFGAERCIAHCRLNR